MNRLIQDKWPWITGSHGMRAQLLADLSDADLAFSPGGQNVPLGALCREMGDTEYAYIQSFKTFTQDWAYHNTTAGLESSVAQLTAWYQTLDDEFAATITALTDEDMAKTITREGGFVVPLDLQLDIYLQALLIFFGKLTTYLKALDKSLPKDVRDYIG